MNQGVNIQRYTVHTGSDSHKHFAFSDTHAVSVMGAHFRDPEVHKEAQHMEPNAEK